MDTEVKRKSVHTLSSLFILPIFLSSEYFPILIYVSLLAALWLEFTRLHIGRLLLFDDLLRESERKRPAGYFYLLLGLGILVALSHNYLLRISGILLAAVADAISAIVGIKLGKRVRRILGKTRSLEGTVAGFLSSLAILVPIFGPAIGLMGSLIYVLNDLLWPGDDNVTNPLVPLVAWKLLLLVRILRER